MWRDKTIFAISFGVFAAYIGSTMIVPVRVLFVEQEGASLTVIGAMASAFLVANFIFQYPMGWLADRWGRKRLMVAGLVAQAAVALLYLVVADPLLFVLLRFVEGIAGATLLSPARALIADRTPPDKRGQAYGVFNAFFNASWVLGPGMGTLFASFGYQLVFMGAFAAKLLAIVVVGLLIGGIPKGHAQAVTTRRRVSLRELLSLPLLGAYVLAFGDYLWVGFDQTLFPIWMHDNLGASVELIGLTYIVWGIPSAILSPVGGRFADRLRRSSIILLFGIAQIPLYIIYGMLNVAWPMLFLMFAHSAIYALMQPSVDSHVAASTVNEIRGRVQGVYSSVGLAGAFAGANGFSLLYEADFRLPLFAMGLVFGVCVLVGGLMIRKSEVVDIVCYG